MGKRDTQLRRVVVDSLDKLVGQPLGLIERSLTKTYLGLSGMDEDVDQVAQIILAWFSAKIYHFGLLELFTGEMLQELKLNLVGVGE